MKLWSRYHVARSVNEALNLLSDYAGRAQLIAGGTDLLLDIQQGNHPPAEALIDITRIDELTAIEIETDGAHVLIGAAVTHSAIVANAAIRERATCLSESCGLIGGPQVRNVATLGGNVAHALPAADGTLSLVALDTEAEVASPAGRAWYPIQSLYLGAGQSRVDSTRELITRFRVPLAGERDASAFGRIMRPQGVALPILGCAVAIRLDASRESFEAASICISPVGPVPARASGIEALLIGQPAQESTIREAAQAARQQLSPRTSKYRATAEYRIEMIDLLLYQALNTALSRVGQVVG
jgi:carbon-monoxide dehydrogenase medium subunit